VSEEIKEENSNHYNVIMVQKVNDAVNEAYITKLVPQTFSKQGYEKLKSQFQYLGYHKIVLLHSPEPVKEKEAKEKEAKEVKENDLLIK
jgi:CRISPR/Cas system-associated endonuclease/helicase Cas3